MSIKNVPKIFSVQCKSCGSAIGFDIPSQSYRCSHCGSVGTKAEAAAAWRLPGSEGIPGTIHQNEITCPACGGTASFDAERDLFLCPWCGTETKGKEDGAPAWRAVQSNNWQSVKREEEIASCTGCGAKVLFRKDEASESCSFCGGNLIRGALQEESELPELLIPFVLTEEEAKQRLEDWVKTQKDTKDTRRVKQNIPKLTGYYLPYRLIRGPLKGYAYRDLESRDFHFRGFLEHAVVNSSGQLDNQILDAAEPFDLSKLQPFDPALVGGHRVKLADIAQGTLEERSFDEARESYRPYIAKALQNDDVELKILHGELMYLPILLPMYVLKVGKYLAVVNGQTGRVAVESSKKPKTSMRWLIEPAALTLISILLTAYFFPYDAEMIFTTGMVAAIAFFAIYSGARNQVLHRKIFIGKNSAAERRDGALVLEEGEDILKNPFPSTPCFYERNGEREVPVTFRFYAPDRMFFVILKLLGFVFLPAILAILFHRGMDGLHFQYGAAWYITAGGITIIYATRGLRWDIFNHPILYEILPDGKKKLYGDRKSRSLSILSTFGLDTKEERKALGGIWYALLGFMIFLLLGSTMATLP